MDVFIEKINKKKTISFEGTATELLNTLNINSETVLVVKNNELIEETEKISNEDSVKLVSVISGG